MTTMYQVARLAGVSVTTVSHVVNKTRPVSAQTAASVMQAMESIGYRHNLAARGLATRASFTIGLAMSVITNPYFADLIRAVERELRAAGYTLMLADTHDDPEVAADVIEHLLARRVDGMVVQPIGGDGPLDATFASLVAQEVPTVFLDRRVELDADQVHSESAEAVSDLVAHLAGHGHRRIAYVSGDSNSTSGLDRLAGYRAGIAAHGLDEDPGLVLEGRSNGPTAERVVRERLARPAGRPTALLVSNNQMTLGALRAVQSLRLRVPEDLALACYDDFEWAPLFTPQLTAVAQDSEAMGRTAVELLLARLADSSRAPQRIVIPTELRIRGSCGCAVVRP